MNAKFNRKTRWLGILVPAMTALTVGQLEAQESFSADYSDRTSNENCIELTIDGLLEAYGEDLIYSWDFGDGQNGFGLESEHCYEKSGKYVAKLSIIDPVTEHLFPDDFELEVVISPPLQLEVEVNKKAEAYEFTAHLKNGSAVSPTFYWELGDTYVLGKSISGMTLAKGETIRALCRYTQADEVKYLAKTIKITAE